ncbi:hypothetical protein ACMHYB_61305 [Sorangium sp. So ce1128]
MNVRIVKSQIPVSTIEMRIVTALLELKRQQHAVLLMQSGATTELADAEMQALLAVREFAKSAFPELALEITQE